MGGGGLAASTLRKWKGVAMDDARGRGDRGLVVAEAGGRRRPAGDTRQGTRVGAAMWAATIVRGGMVADSGPGKQHAGRWCVATPDDRWVLWGFKLIHIKFKLHLNLIPSKQDLLKLKKLK
jgi:hypothetical protein